METNTGVLSGNFRLKDPVSNTCNKFRKLLIRSSERPFVCVREESEERCKDKGPEGTVKQT